MNITCKNCGNEILEGAQFCSNCGAKIGHSEFNETNPKNEFKKSPSDHIKENINNIQSTLNKNQHFQKIKSIIMANKKISIIAAVIIALIGIIAFSGPANSPKGVLKAYCSSVSKMDFDSAVSYTSASDKAKLILGSAYSKKEFNQYVNELVRDLRDDIISEFFSVKVEVLDMEKIEKTKNYASYDVTVRVSARTIDGDSYSDIYTESVDFAKYGSKWKLEDGIDIY